MKILSLITTRRSKPGGLSFIFWNTNKDIFDKMWELSDPPLTAMQLKCSQTQNFVKKTKITTLFNKKNVLRHYQEYLWT